MEPDVYLIRCDLGFRKSAEERLRLIGVSMPSSGAPERVKWEKAKTHIQKLIESHPLRVWTQSEDPAGRWWWSHIHIRGPQSDRHDFDRPYCLAEYLIQTGWARRWDGEGFRPTFPSCEAYPFVPAED